jgi:hypothetical protein
LGKFQLSKGLKTKEDMTSIMLQVLIRMHIFHHVTNTLWCLYTILILSYMYLDFDWHFNQNYQKYLILTIWSQLWRVNIDLWCQHTLCWLSPVSDICHGDKYNSSVFMYFKPIFLYVEILLSSFIHTHLSKNLVHLNSFVCYIAADYSL